MTVPTKWELTLPVLQATKDGQIYHVGVLIESVATDLNLDAVRDETLSSGEKRFDNRLRWASWVLTRAELLEKVGRAKFRITDKGLEILKSSPTKIDLQFLKDNTRYSEEMKSWKSKETETVDAYDGMDLEELGPTATEIIQEAYKQHSEKLASELLDTVKACSPKFFEELVIDLLLKMEYGGSRAEVRGIATGGSGDGGVDGVIKEDALGLDLIYVQAKRWQGTVTAGSVRDFIGALPIKKSRKGIMITTSKFPQDSYEKVKNLETYRVALVDGAGLAKLMMTHGVGVSEDVSFSVKKLDESYFEKDEQNRKLKESS